MHKYKIDPSKGLLGSGGEGKVLEVTKLKEDGTEEGLFVMKQRMCTSIEEANSGLSEALALARFQNEHIVSFEDIFIHVPPENREMCYVCIVMEHCSGGNLFDSIMNRNSAYASNNNTHSTISNCSNDSNNSSNFNTSSSNLLAHSSSQPLSASTNNLHSSQPASPELEGEGDIESELANIKIKHCPSAPELSITSPSYSRPISLSPSPVNFSPITRRQSNNSLNPSPSVSLSSSPSNTPILNPRHSSSIRTSNRLSTATLAAIQEQGESASPPTFTSTFRDSTKLLPKMVLDSLTEHTFSSVADIPTPPPPEPEIETPSLSSTPERSLPAFMTSPSLTSPRRLSESKSNKKIKPKTKSDTVDKASKRLRSPSSIGNIPYYCSPASLSSPALTQSPSLQRAASPGPAPTLDPFPREQLLDWMYQICSGLNAIHNAKLVHRDLKSENIFISNGRVKIGDFGLAVMHKYEKVKGIAGTYYYSSPELLQDKVYDRSGDIFALGCIFYEMATLTLLPIARKCFGSEFLKNTFSAAQVLLDFPDGMKDIAELVLQMINPEPTMRPHIDTILKHQIFSSIRRVSSPPGVLSPVVEPMNLTGGVVRQLIESDKDAFAEVMSKAYFPDTFIRYVLEKNKNNHPLIMVSVFKQMFVTFRSKSYSVWGYFDKSKKLIACCVWVPPDNEARKPTISEIFQILFNGKVLTTVGLPAIRRWRKALNRVQAVAVDHSWHLLYAAVDSDFQNRGIGKKLVAPVLEWADNEERIATASVWNDRALHFLEQMGFSAHSVHTDETGKGLPFTYMKRKPNKVE